MSVGLGKHFKKLRLRFFYPRFHQGRGISAAFSLLVSCSITFSIAAVAIESTISPGDTVQIYIPGSQQPDQTYLVDIKGEIDLGIYGRIILTGKPLKTAEDLLKQHLSKYLKSVEGISLFIKQKGRIVLITGCVAQPGVVSIQQTDDLWQAIHRAGGLSSCADVARVAIYRNGLGLNVDLRSYLTGDTKDPLPALITGDMIFVPYGPGLTGTAGPTEVFLSLEALKHKVFVIGAVNTPGMYNLTPKLDLLTLIAAANGPLATADLGHATMITQSRQITIDLQKEMKRPYTDRALLPDEGGVIVYIPTLQENIDNRLGAHINVVGGFTRTGRIPISGPIALMDAVALAGGHADSAKSKRLRVIEDGPGYSLVSEYNLKRYLRHGGAMGRVIVKPGSTLALGRINYQALNTVLQGLNLVSMVSSTFLLWVNYGSQLKAGN
jgi:protein involved in polysaccharide export with SLBB domain